VKYLLIFFANGIKMQWSTALTIFFSCLICGFVIAFFVLLIRKQRQQSHRKNGQIHSRLRRPQQLPLEALNAYQQMVYQMDDDQLQQELQRIIQATQNPEAPALNDTQRDTRAQEILQALVRNSQNVHNDPIGNGKGIVIVAGGYVHGTGALMLVKLIREHECQLPIEVWHRNDEMSEHMKEAFVEMQCEVRNIDQVASVAFNNVFAAKPLAVYHSAFRHVLLLDADNLCLRNPEYLFEYLEQYPAVFWPDHWRLDRKALCWNVLTKDQLKSVDYGFAQDSGQLLVDKTHCMKALYLCGVMNIQLHSQFPRLLPKPLNFGDKDSWHFSWLATNTEFLMIPHRPGGAGRRDRTGQYFGNALVQMDNIGEPLFIHKMRQKWATEVNKPQWTDYLVFANSQRGYVDQWTHRFEDGPVNRQLFTQVFEDFEEVCWKQLNAIRNLNWYSQEFAAELKKLK
jgi:alpha 1,2-mannosyltransferase